MAVIGKLKKEKDIIIKEKEQLETQQESMEINITQIDDEAQVSSKIAKQIEALNAKLFNVV